MSIDLGAAIYIALKPILKIYTIIMVGFLLARYNIVTMEISRGISNMVVNAILPCLTFNKIVGNISDKDIKEIGVIVLSAVILFTLGTVGAIIVRYTLNVPKKWTWGLLFAGCFPNISDLPIAYVQSMSNGMVFASSSVDRGVAYCCIFMMCQNFLMMNFGMWRIVGLDFRATLDKEKGEINTFNEADVDNSSQISKNREHTDLWGIEPREDDPAFPPSSFSLHVTPYREFPSSYLKEESSTGIRRSRTAETVLHSITDRSGRSRSRRTSMSDVINEYSAIDQIRDGELDLSIPLTVTEELGHTNSAICSRRRADTHSIQGTMEAEIDSLCNDNNNNVPRRLVSKDKLKWLTYFLVNFIRPASLGASLGIIVAMIPWVKALFVHTDVHIHNAPDGEPVLNFLMDFTSYIGNASVPLGLLLLGGTLARLQVKNIPSGILEVAIVMTIFRLMIIPIVGIAWADQVYRSGWIETVIGKFVMILTWSMPSATAQVYFTAFYTPLEGSHIQLDCLSILFLMQYAILFITVPFVITYALKKDLGY